MSLVKEMSLLLCMSRELCLWLNRHAACTHTHTINQSSISVFKKRSLKRYKMVYFKSEEHDVKVVKLWYVKTFVHH